MNISVLKISNVTCTNANTEYSLALSEHASYFQIKARQMTSELKLAFASGESGTNYITLPMGSSEWMKGKISGKKTLFFQSPQAGTVAEILEGY